VAAVFLAAYYLLAVETYLATYAIGRFKISWGPVGGTELRLVLAALNVLVLFRPRVSLGGSSWLVFDVLGAAASVALVVLAAAAGILGTRALVREEGWAPAADRPGPASKVRPPRVEGEALSLV
jgi:hypothetical protein